MVNDPVNKKIPIAEPIFGPTIQGEGAVIGEQTYFIRFAGCDYKCGMCDSMHAVDPKQIQATATWHTQGEIMELLFAHAEKTPFAARTITLSGGNPCIHNLSYLCRSLKITGWKLVCETQGTIIPDWLSWLDTLTISPKGPGMKENTDFDALDRFVQEALMLLPQRFNFKVVVFDQRDLEFARCVYERYHQLGPIPFYLSLGNPYPPGIPDPFDEEEGTHQMQFMRELIDRYKILWEDIQNDPILSNFRFLPQWHVFVWGNARGK